MPTIVDSIAYNTNGLGGSISLAVPVTYLPGDLLVFGVNSRGNGTTATTPTGFTKNVDIARSTNGRHYVFTKIAVSSEPSVATSFSASNNHTAILLVVRSVNQSNPINVSDSASGGATAHPCPSVTTTVNNCLIINFACGAILGTFTYTWSPGLTYTSGSTVSGGANNVIGSSYFTQSIAGTSPINTATMDNSTSNYATSTLAIAPGSPSVQGIATLQGVSTLQF